MLIVELPKVQGSQFSQIGILAVLRGSAIRMYGAIEEYNTPPVRTIRAAVHAQLIRMHGRQADNENL